MDTIRTTARLAEFCASAAAFPFVTVDTEFLRERTYYAQLCLVQLAVPSDAPGSAVVVDTLAEGLDLAPLYDLFRAPDVVKVFHAARQDLEIFYVDRQVIPAPLFDTQIAAMVCGFGDQVGYETLVRSICKASVDKSSRFTDWSQRPLSDKQLEYAIADVTHLRDIYVHLARRLDETGRTPWVAEELATLSRPETYVVEPTQAWRRIKTRTNAPRFLAVVRELAEYRERTAQARNVPRGRIFKDDAIVELAATRPRKPEDLSKSRLLTRECRKGEIADAILACVNRAMDLPADALPVVPDLKPRKPGAEGLSDLLRVLLKARAEEADVAQKLIASASDLDAIAVGETDDIAALRGWRRTVFGADAERLREGRIALSARGGSVSIVEV